MDATTQTTLNNFINGAAFGELEATMAGSGVTHRMPASMAELTSFMSFNEPGQGIKMEALEFGHLLGGGADIDLGRLQGPAETGPQVRGPNLIARKPSGPGGMS